MKALLAGIALLVVLGVGFLLYSSPSATSPEMTDADRLSIAAEIESLTREMTKSGRPDDFEDWLAFYSDSPESYFTDEPVLFVQGTFVAPTMQALRGFLDPSRWNRQSTNFTLQSSRVAVLSPDNAVQVAELHFSITNMDGETGPSYLQVATNVWVKEDGGWKIMHHHNSWDTTPIEEGTEG
jgi:uncharacterized protein (TIGR02246 family)